MIDKTYQVGGWTTVHPSASGHTIVTMTRIRKGMGWDTYTAKCECGSEATRLTYGITTGSRR